MRISVKGEQVSDQCGERKGMEGGKEGERERGKYEAKPVFSLIQ